MYKVRPECRPVISIRLDDVPILLSSPFRGLHVKPRCVMRCRTAAGRTNVQSALCSRRGADCGHLALTARRALRRLGHHRCAPLTHPSHALRGALPLQGAVQAFALRSAPSRPLSLAFGPRAAMLRGRPLQAPGASRGPDCAGALAAATRKPRRPQPRGAPTSAGGRRSARPLSARERLHPTQQRHFRSRVPAGLREFEPCALRRGRCAPWDRRSA